MRVLHVDHGLQAVSSDWAQHVQHWCNTQQLPCTVLPVQVGAGNLEAAARQARYAALYAAMQPNEVLVLGHHQHDQAETVLMRLCQGTGVTGLAAMRQHDTVQGIARWRPFLQISRSDISDCANQLALPYVNDPANDDLRFDRVWLRQQLWPQLLSRWPSALAGMQRTASLMQDSADILTEVALRDLAECQISAESVPAVSHAPVLSVPAVALLSAARQRLLLSRWMQQDGAYAPPYARVEAVRSLMSSRMDAEARVDWGEVQIRRYQQQLYRLPAVLPIATDQPVELAANLLLRLPTGVWQLQQNPQVETVKILPNACMLRARCGGERLHVLGRVGHWPLKKFLQSIGVAPWHRMATHLLYAGDDLLGVFTVNGFYWTHIGQQQLLGWQWLRVNDANI